RGDVCAALDPPPHVGEAPSLAARHALDAQTAEGGEREHETVQPVERRGEPQAPAWQRLVELVEDPPGVERDLVADNRPEAMRRAERGAQRARRGFLLHE